MPSPKLEIANELDKLSELFKKDAAPVAESDAIYDLPDFLKSCGIEFPELKAMHLVPAELKLKRVDIQSLRHMFKDGVTEDELVEIFNVPLDAVKGILTGEIGPFAGGPILQPERKSGCDPRMFATHSNDKLFASGIIIIAKMVLDPIQFEAFIGSNGLDSNSLRTLEEVRNYDRQPKTYQRYRDFLLGHQTTTPGKRRIVRPGRTTKSADGAGGRSEMLPNTAGAGGDNERTRTKHDQ